MAEWRIGQHYGIHVYEGDRPVATFHTVEDAKAAVRDHNHMDAEIQSLKRQLEFLKSRERNVARNLRESAERLERPIPDYSRRGLPIVADHTRKLTEDNEDMGF